MHSIAWWPTLAVLAVATYTDLRSRRIPNWLVLPFMVAGIAGSGWVHGLHGGGHRGQRLDARLAWRGSKPGGPRNWRSAVWHPRPDGRDGNGGRQALRS